jgi:hypothetical protein
VQPSQFMLVEMLDSIQKIPVERHERRLGNLKRSEQTRERTSIREGPPKRRGEFVGVLGAEDMTAPWYDLASEVLKPHRTLLIVEHHQGRGGCSTSNAVF